MRLSVIGEGAARGRVLCTLIAEYVLGSQLSQFGSGLCCLYVPPLSPHDREYAVAVTLSPRELPDLLTTSLAAWEAALWHPRSRGVGRMPTA